MKYENLKLPELQQIYTPNVSSISQNENGVIFSSKSHQSHKKNEFAKGSLNGGFQEDSEQQLKQQKCGNINFATLF